MSHPKRVSKSEKKIGYASIFALNRLISKTGISRITQILEKGINNLSKEDLSVLIELIFESIGLKSDLESEPQISPINDLKKELAEGMHQLLESMPDIQRLLSPNENYGFTRKDADEKAERISNAIRMMGLGFEKGVNRENNIWFLETARDSLYSIPTTGADAEVKTKFDIILNAIKPIFEDAKRLEQMKNLVHIELFTDLISVAYTSDTTLEAIYRIEKLLQSNDVDRVVRLVDDYATLYEKCELSMKLLEACIRISRDEEMNSDFILRSNASDSIRYVNGIYPSLIDLDPFVRNAAVHNQQVLKIRSPASYVLKNRKRNGKMESRTYSITELKNISRRGLNTTVCLFSLQVALLISVFDFFIERTRSESDGK